MTNEEAIKNVIHAFDAWENEWNCGHNWDEEHEARDMAITALKRKQSNISTLDIINDYIYTTIPDAKMTYDRKMLVIAILKEIKEEIEENERHNL